MEGEIPGVANPANHDEESSEWKERKPGLMNEMVGDPVMVRHKTSPFDEIPLFDGEDVGCELFCC